MNTQQAYEYMRAYLTRPGARRAFAPGAEMCSYETVLDGETHRCAVGCLLAPDDLASGIADFEGGVNDLWEGGNTLPEYLVDVSLVFLGKAQSVHDDEMNWDDDGFNVHALDNVAKDFGLTVVSTESPPIPEPPLVTC